MARGGASVGAASQPAVKSVGITKVYGAGATVGRALDVLHAIAAQ